MFPKQTAALFSFLLPSLLPFLGLPSCSMPPYISFPSLLFASFHLLTFVCPFSASLPCRFFPSFPPTFCCKSPFFLSNLTTFYAIFPEHCGCFPFSPLPPSKYPTFPITSNPLPYPTPPHPKMDLSVTHPTHPSPPFPQIHPSSKHLPPFFLPTPPQLIQHGVEH